MLDKKKSIIIVAGGKGTRMGVSLPKQFLVLGDKPILMHTLSLFHAYDPHLQIVLVLPESEHKYWNTLCSEYKFDVPFTLACGGESRFHSVSNGLAKVSADIAWVGVHDGVRPFVSQEVIASCFDLVRRYQAVIPTIDVFETLRHFDGDVSHTVDRSQYRLVQTPQVFSADVLKKAYRQAYNACFTDDASVVEALGLSVKCIAGNRENIKVTTPFDLKIGEALL